VRLILQCPAHDPQEDALKKMMLTALAMAFALTAAGLAQQTGFKRTVLQQQKLSVAGREAVTAIAEFQPGGTVGAHTHPGEEIGYILEGTISLEQGGKTVTLTAGQTFFIPNGQVHNATNKGTSVARVLANYVVESGKPVATPVAAK
jgi:quercetin dioxygenase-like cupin family protein